MGKSKLRAVSKSRTICPLMNCQEREEGTPYARLLLCSQRFLRLFQRQGQQKLVFQLRLYYFLVIRLCCQIIGWWLSYSQYELQEDYELYKDETDKFSLLVPRDWIKGEGKADGQRSVTAFYPESSTVSNVSVIITGLSADYTRMESFGNVDAFAESLVNSLDRSWKRPRGQAAKLLTAKSKNGMYYVEYSLQKPGESKIRLLSVVGMAMNGWYNRLYTVTGQYLEDDADKYGSKIEKSISSFKIA